MARAGTCWNSPEYQSDRAAVRSRRTVSSRQARSASHAVSRISSLVSWTATQMYLQKGSERSMKGSERSREGSERSRKGSERSRNGSERAVEGHEKAVEGQEKAVNGQRKAAKRAAHRKKGSTCAKKSSGECRAISRSTSTLAYRRGSYRAASRSHSSARRISNSTNSAVSVPPARARCLEPPSPGGVSVLRLEWLGRLVRGPRCRARTRARRRPSPSPRRPCAAGSPAGSLRT